MSPKRSTAKRKRKEGPEQPEVAELKGTLDLAEMLNENRNKYLMVNLLAQRARELNLGARPLVRMDAPHSHQDMVIAEALAGGLKVSKREEKGKVLVDLVENN